MKRAFTLIELIMVIVIIGTLAMVAIPMYTGLHNNARIAATRGGLGNIRAAVSIAYVKNGTGGGSATFPAAVDASLFRDGAVPVNEITRSSAVNNVSDTVSGTATSASGWWYVTSGSNMGQVGAYVDGIAASDSSSW
jgi:type IV pilus assembly protein PilA